MDNDKFMQYLMLAMLGAIVFLAVMCVQSVRGLLLEEGECWTFGNTTVCASNCTKITEEACKPFIENATADIKDKCLSFENISRQINATFGRISKGFIDDCNKWNNESKKWKRQWEICDDELHNPKFMESKETIETLEGDLDTCTKDKNAYYTKFSECDKNLEYANSNVYTGAVIAFFAGAGLVWYFGIKRKEAHPEGSISGYETVEGD